MKRLLLPAAALWLCAFLVCFAVLAARTQPELAFLALAGVGFVWLVREASR